MTTPQLPAGCRSHVVPVGEGRVHCVEAGDGPLVLLVHGFPESWYSWRHQLPALAEAGYRAVAIDVRGYGRSSKPLAVEDYRMVRLVADNVGLVAALGFETAVVIGHDWGAPIAWNSALLRPDVFTAVAGLSVPFAPPSDVRPTTMMRAIAGDEEFYVEYFQEPGRAEAEIEADVRDWLLGFMFTASGDAPPPDLSDGTVATVRRGGLMKDRFRRPDPLPAWLTDADLDVYVERVRTRRPARPAEPLPQRRSRLGGPRRVPWRPHRRAVTVHRWGSRRAHRLGGSGDRRVRADAAEAAPLGHSRRLRPLDPTGTPRRGQRGARRFPRESVTPSADRSVGPDPCVRCADPSR